MASSDVVLSAPDVVSVPMDYDVPPAQEIVPKCVTASLDGSASVSAYLPMLELLSPAGQVVFRSPTSTLVAAGGSADVSWFQLSNAQGASSSPVTPYEELIFSTPGLQLYWKLDEAAGAGTIADSAGGNNGTVYGLVNQGTAPLADVLSATFVGGMAGRKTDTPVDQSTQLMTALVWIKTIAAAGTTYIAFADTTSAGGRWFDIGITAAGHIFADVFSTAAAGHTFGGGVKVNDGVKHCIAITYNATNPGNGTGAVGSVVVDGVLDTATPIAMGGFGLALNNHAVVIGAKWQNAFDDPAGTNQFPGTLDEFALFNTPLTIAQLAAINTAGRV